MTFRIVTGILAGILGALASFGFSAGGAWLVTDYLPFKVLLLFGSFCAVAWSIQGLNHAYDRWRDRRVLAWVFSVFLTLLALTYTGGMSIVFFNAKWADMAAERTHITTTNSDLNSRIDSVKADIKELEKQREWIPQQTRPAATIKAEIAAMQRTQRWGWTKGCTDATTSKSREFCVNFAQKQSELASSNSRNEYNNKLQSYKNRLAALYAERKSQQVFGNVDPGGEFFEAITKGKIGSHDARLILILLAVLFFLCLESLPGFIVARRWEARKAEKKVKHADEDADQDAAPSALESASKLNGQEKIRINSDPDLTPKKVNSEIEIYNFRRAQEEQTLLGVSEKRVQLEGAREWLDTCTAVDGLCRVRASVAYGNYIGFCQEVGFKPATEDSFKRTLMPKLGHKVSKSNGSWAYDGFRLIREFTQEPQEVGYVPD